MPILGFQTDIESGPNETDTHPKHKEVEREIQSENRTDVNE